MILTIIALIALLVLVSVVTLVIGGIGAAFFAVFGDLIVFGLIIWLIVKLFRRRK